MALQVHKYPVQPGQTELLAPVGAKLLSLQYQGGQLCAWGLVDPAMPYVTRRIMIVGTGWDIREEPGLYVGTAITNGGAFVWHLFDKGTS